MPVCSSDTACRRRFRLSRCSWSAILVALVLFLVTVAGPALAHSDLVSSDPADGAVLTEAPTAVTLTFNEDVTSTGSAVVVTGPDGARVGEAAPRIDGPRVVLPLPTVSAEGAYTVAFRVVSADGHVITGSIGYTLDLPGTAVSPTASPPADPTPSVAASPASGTAASSTPWGTVAVVALGVVVVAGLAVALALRTRD